MRALQGERIICSDDSTSAGTETARHEGTARRAAEGRQVTVQPARRLPAMRALQEQLRRVILSTERPRHGDCPP